MYVERLDWLAKNPRFTQRYAMHVGGLCREMTNKAVAELERLHDSTVKDLDKIYMQKQVACAGMPAPRAIGVVFGIRRATARRWKANRWSSGESREAAAWSPPPATRCAAWA